jgi:tagatose-1,6-bisphosphate aldolase non-catalytic subunit AgaZ/GatZ
VGEKSLLYKTVKVQSFFCTRGLQKYFIVEVDVVENGVDLDSNQVVEEQLNAWHRVRKQLEEEIQVIEDAAKTDKTGWFKRTGWLEFLKGRNPPALVEVPWLWFPRACALSNMRFCTLATVRPLAR